MPAGWSYDLEVGVVVIGTPCYGGMVTARFASALAATTRELAGRGIVSAWVTTQAESLVQRARDVIAAHFLALPQATHLFWIDSDIEWQPEDVIRLLGHDVPVIGGLYPKKTLPVDFPWHPRVDDQGRARRDPRTGRVEILNAPTGFLCTQRAVYEQLATAYPQSKITALQGAETVQAHLYDFFPAALEDGILWSEDYGFCRRWRAIGGEVWIDPAVKLVHCGMHAFEGDPNELFNLPAVPGAA